MISASSTAPAWVVRSAWQPASIERITSRIASEALKAGIMARIAARLRSSNWR